MTRFAESQLPFWWGRARGAASTAPPGAHDDQRTHRRHGVVPAGVPCWRPSKNKKMHRTKVRFRITQGRCQLRHQRRAAGRVTIRRRSRDRSGRPGRGTARFYPVRPPQGL